MPDGNFSDAPYEDAGASLLAAQPPTAPDKLKKTSDDWETVFAYLEARLGALRIWRYSWWSYWAVLAQYFVPKRYVWFVSPNRTSRGSPINDSIIDSTGAMAVNVCASGMWTGLTSPSRPWFKLTNALPWITLDAEAKAWLEDTEQRIYAVLHKSNFYTIMAQAFQDVTVFGTAPVIIYEDREDIIRLYLPCAGEYYLAVGARFSVDVLYREFVLTVNQIVDMFRLENCPEEVQRRWEQGGASLEQEFIVAHAIEPNFALSGKGRSKNNKPINVVPGKYVYREVYWLKGIKSTAPLSKRGFLSKPFMAARWSTVSNDAYGRSPCMDALGDNKQIQLETLRKAEYIEKGVRPPMGADPELKNEPASILPAQITYINTNGTQKKGFWPLFEVTAQWVKALMDDIAQVSQRIERCLFVDVFLAITRMQGVQPRNELELTKRDLERLQLLGPFISLFENEFAGPAIKRVLDIMQRRRMLKPIPPSLANVQLKIEYMSIMRLAQQSARSIAMKDVFATAGELSSAAKAAGVPDPIRVLNLDKAMREYASDNNYPESCLFTVDEVKEHDQARQQATQQEQMGPQGLAAVQAAHTLSQTPTAGGSMLNALMTGDTQNGQPGEQPQ